MRPDLSDTHNLSWILCVVNPFLERIFEITHICQVAQKEGGLFVFFDVYMKLCQERGIAPYSLAKHLGASSNTIVDQWKKGSIPRKEMLEKVAEYFGVPVIDLLDLQTGELSVAEKIRRLCKAEGIAVSELEKRLEFSNGSIGKWEKNKPTPERLQQVADYFGVSVGLFDNEKTPEISHRGLSEVLVQRIQSMDISAEKFAIIDRLLSIPEDQAQTYLDLLTTIQRISATQGSR